MTGKTLINTAHQRSGTTALAFSRDGAYIYTGGADSLGRIWKTDQGTDQDPDAEMEAGESITCVAVGVCRLYATCDVTLLLTAVTGQQLVHG